MKGHLSPEREVIGQTDILLTITCAGQCRRWLIALVALFLGLSASAATYSRIVVAESAHPAIKSAASILAQNLALPDSAVQTAAQLRNPSSGEIVLTVAPLAARQPFITTATIASIKHDGYAIRVSNGGAMICGVRPRSLLFAAGEVALWRDRNDGTLVRDPAFVLRAAAQHGRKSLPEFVAALGVNLIVGGQQGAVSFRDTLPEVYTNLPTSLQREIEGNESAVVSRGARLSQACRDADVDYFPFLYGNDLQRWSPRVYSAIVTAYPSVKGTPPPSSWERATLCPSDPITWKIIEAYVKESAQDADGEGIYATFWDNYGLNCQCERCVKNGMNQFSNQLYACVQHYHAALAPLGKKLIVRTWSSGVPHWFGTNWVHAPGYDDFGGSSTELWSRVIQEVSPDVILQTKVYQADCQPDARFSTLLGHAQQHREVAEWQITGQTTGRFYFPASTVDHTAWTMKRSHSLIGAEGGVCVFPGGTGQSSYDLFDDIANSINLAAWRELSWDPDADVDEIWMRWAVPIFGEKTARHVVNALKLSEKTVNHLFSTLGLGSDTNSGFPEDIRRREALLKYTNRHFLPEGRTNLEPTKENIARVIAEKDECLKLIDDMLRELELAKPDLRPEQAAELQTRFDWLREFGIVAKALDESLWRYRYLRFQADMLTTAPEQMKYLAAAYDTVREHQPRLFRYETEQKFSCYSVPLDRLSRRPSLGNPMPLMRELYSGSRECVEEYVGPDYIPNDWRR